MADIEKLDLIIKNIKANPEQHRQATWGVRTACGTAFCVAGWTGVIDQAPMEWQTDEDCGSPNCGYCVNAGEQLATIDGRDPEDYGRDSLRLTNQQAGTLFSGVNTIAEIEAMRDVLAANPDATGEDLEAVWGPS